MLDLPHLRPTYPAPNSSAYIGYLADVPAVEEGNQATVNLKVRGGLRWGQEQ